MIKYLIIFYLALAATAFAQYVGGYSGIYNLGTSAGGGGGGCTNKLDFTQACNSQYIGLL